jgi:hypothetical protein
MTAASPENGMRPTGVFGSAAETLRDKADDKQAPDDLSCTAGRLQKAKELKSDP